MPSLSEECGEITKPQTRKLREVRSGFTSFIEGDVVFAKITPCMENGKSAIIGKLLNDIGFGTTEFYVLRCSEELSNRYLWHMLRDRSFREKAKAVMTGAVGQQRVPKSFLEEYPIQLPLIDEQNEIVKLLDNALKKEQIIIQNAENVINQIDIIKNSILTRAFRGELGTNDPTELPISFS
ncbi:MAG: restriction endonuclease subunit S [Clostridia bacterium]|nr:restriction endonuclease subunit S [Clostridia bacterium]